MTIILRSIAIIFTAKIVNFFVPIHKIPQRLNPSLTQGQPISLENISYSDC